MNVFDIEAAYIARLQLPAGVAANDTFTPIDWTSDSAPAVGVHVVFDGISKSDQAPGNVLATARFSAHVYLQPLRAGAAGKANAQAALLACLRAAIGWAPVNHLETTIEAGAQTGFDNETGLARVSISFAVPAPLAGLA